MGGIASLQEFNQKEKLCQRVHAHTYTDAEQHTHTQTNAQDMNISRVHALEHSSSSFLMKSGNIVERHV